MWTVSNTCFVNKDLGWSLTRNTLPNCLPTHRGTYVHAKHWTLWTLWALPQFIITYIQIKGTFRLCQICVSLNIDYVKTLVFQETRLIPAYADCQILVSACFPACPSVRPSVHPFINSPKAIHPFMDILFIHSFIEVECLDDEMFCYSCCCCL